MERLGCTDTKFSYQKEHSGQDLFLFKAFCTWAAHWSLLEPPESWCPRVSMFQARGYIPAPITQQSFHWCVSGDSQEKSEVSFESYSLSLAIPVFFSIPGFLVYLYHFHMMSLECFSSFLEGSSWRFSLYALDDDSWFAILPFPPQTLSHGGMSPAAHSILSPTHRY